MYLSYLGPESCDLLFHIFSSLIIIGSQALLFLSALQAQKVPSGGPEQLMALASLFIDMAGNAPFLICSAAFVSIQKEKCSILKGQSLKNGLSYMFWALGNILNSQLKQWNTKVKIKETIPIQSQICSSYYRMFSMKQREI